MGSPGDKSSPGLTQGSGVSPMMIVAYVNQRCRTTHNMLLLLAKDGESVEDCTQQAKASA